MTDVVSPIVQPSEAAPAEAKENKHIDVVIAPEKGEASSDIDNLIPLDRYLEDNKKPYTADYLGIFFYPALTKELDVNGILPAVQEIEDYISQEITDRRLTNTVGSYKEVMEKVKKEIEMSENEKIESKIDRIKLYISLMNEQKNKRKIDAYLDKTAIDLKSMFERAG